MASRDEDAKLPAPVSVEEALRDPAVSIRVPDGKEVTIGPFSEHARSFRIAEIQRFEDLHRLGFISEQISQDRAIDAVRADDRLHREALLRREEAHGTCSCGTTEGERHQGIKRRLYQDNLIEILQPIYRHSLRADDAAVVHPYRHLQAWLSRPNKFLVGLYALQDIDIGKRSTLIMTPTVRALYAGNINIGNEGRLRFESGNVHVRCLTLNGPNPFGPSPLLVIDKYLPGVHRELLETRQ